MIDFLIQYLMLEQQTCDFRISTHCDPKGNKAKHQCLTKPKWNMLCYTLHWWTWLLKFCGFLN